jgi:hypothetical protein
MTEFMIRQLAEMLRRLPPDGNKAFKEKVIKATETRLWMRLEDAKAFLTELRCISGS